MVSLHLKINFVLLHFRNDNAFIPAFPSLKSDIQFTFSGNLLVTHVVIQEWFIVKNGISGYSKEWNAIVQKKGKIYIYC